MMPYGLYTQAELSYLFTPADHDSGCFALMGFLNDPADNSSQQRVCEAGVMLYFKQRLIRKLECTFPDAPKSIDASRCPREWISDWHSPRGKCMRLLAPVSGLVAFRLR